MPKLVLPILAIALASCSTPDSKVERSSVSVSPSDSIRAEMRAQFGTSPDTLEMRAGAVVRVVYVDTSGHDLSARPRDVAYSEDSVRFDRGFDKAVWLWSRVGKRNGVDTIAVRFHTLAASLPLEKAEYFFYPKQLENPTDRPRFSREAVGARDVGAH